MKASAGSRIPIVLHVTLPYANIFCCSIHLNVKFLTLCECLDVKEELWNKPKAVREDMCVLRGRGGLLSAQFLTLG